LLHDIGHGPFSHAFEEAMEELGAKRRHELRTVDMIMSTEIRGILEGHRAGFADRVAAMIAPNNKEIYESIVSSQFDADRLDYMRRDRMMTGTQQGALDIEWLLANMEVRNIQVGLEDDNSASKAEALVLGRKSIQAAEAYVVGLFQLYQTVYVHKTTRGIEKLFSAYLVRLERFASCGNRKGIPKGGEF
jgi:HD superfamily phosphohydrolase